MGSPFDNTVYEKQHRHQRHLLRTRTNFGRNIGDLIGIRPAAQETELRAVLRLLRDEASAEIARAQRGLEELFRDSGRQVQPRS
jgi:hypothetical protein